jgi:hypothetical protein
MGTSTPQKFNTFNIFNTFNTFAIFNPDLAHPTRLRQRVRRTRCPFQSDGPGTRDGVPSGRVGRVREHGHGERVGVRVVQAKGRSG